MAIMCSDFGLVKIIEDEPNDANAAPMGAACDADALAAQFERMRATTMCGSSYYMAPEVHQPPASKPRPM